MRGLITVHTYDKFWELKCYCKIIRQLLDDIYIVVFCTGDSTKIDADCDEIIQVGKPKDKWIDRIPKNADVTIQSNALHSLSTAMQYSYDYKKKFDYFLSMQGDEWPLNELLKRRVNLLINDNNIDMITEELNRVIDPATILHICSSNLSFMCNTDYLFTRFIISIEYTLNSLFMERKKTIYSYKRECKFGYLPNFGTFHHDTKEYGRETYLDYYDEDNNKILFEGDINRPRYLGDT